MFKVNLSTEIEDGGTAVKTIELPFAPFENLEIREKTSEFGTVLDEYTINWVVWHQAEQAFECDVWFGLGQKIEVEYRDLREKGWAKL